MNKLIAFILLGLFVAGCGARAEEPAVDFDTYGAGVSADIMTTNELLRDADGLDGELVAVSGVVRDVCQSKGCWLVFETATDDVIRVVVDRDEEGEYRFTVPKDISGRQVVVEGQLERQELTEAQQQHYADESETRTAAPVEYRIQAVGIEIETARADA